jgi:peptidoglycan/LPS O-acetylase OafA/YrhL
MFFVISGFVITSMLEREWSKHGRIRFGAFYLRRFRRLTPALAVVVCVTLVGALLFLSPLGPLQTAAYTALGAMFISANAVIASTTGGYFDAPAESNPLLHTWSLSVEEQFYLLFPTLLVIAWLLSRRRARHFWAYVFITLIFGLSFAVAYLGSDGTEHAPLISSILGFYSPFSRAWEFAVGALIALIGANWKRLGRAGGTIATVLGSIAVFASFWLISSATPFPGPWTLLPVLGTGLLLIGGLASNTLISRALASRPLLWVGDRSYSIYLWHWPFIVFAFTLWPGNTNAVLIACAISFIPAWASYRWIEQPMRSRTFGRPRLTATILATMLIPVMCAVTLLWAAPSLASTLRSQQLTAAAEFHIDHQAGCDLRKPLGSYESGTCIWNAQATGAPIYLLGDSHAGAISEGLIAAGNKLNRPVWIAANSGCPFVELVSSVEGRLFTECGDYVRGSMDFFTNAPPGTVVIANNDSWWTDSKVATGPSQDDLSNDSKKKFALTESALEGMIHTLDSYGNDVVIVQTIPRYLKFPFSANQCVTPVSSSAGCEQSETVADLMESQGTNRDMLTRLGNLTGARYFDTWQYMCTNGVCSTNGPDFFRYRDSGHISVGQSEAFAPFWVSFLSKQN